MTIVPQDHLEAHIFDIFKELNIYKESEENFLMINFKTENYYLKIK